MFTEERTVKLQVAEMMFIVDRLMIEIEFGLSVYEQADLDHMSQMVHKFNMVLDPTYS